MKKLRLLLFPDCNRNCKGCCNKEWDLEKLPVCTDFKNWDEIILTGGEPMLRPISTEDTIRRIKRVNTCNVFVYTAKVDRVYNVFGVLDLADGLCVTLHEQKDVEHWEKLNRELPKYMRNKSLRLNIFYNVDFNLDATNWIVKSNISWLKNCPLPENEVFMRL